MSKQSGLGDNLYVGGYDISGDIGSIGRISGRSAVIDQTGIDKSAPERTGGLRDGDIEFTSFMNDSAGHAHVLLRSLPTSDVIVTYCRGTTLGNPSACIVGKEINYDPNRGPDGSLVFTTTAQANGYGLEWGIQGTAGKRTDTSATAGTAIDFGAAAVALEFGLQAYLQVFSFTGTSCTVKIQESSDNGADTYADVVGGTFTAATAITSQRIQTSRTLAIERYLKVTTTGTFSECTFAVTIVRNETMVVF